jgi:hypothetical protein
VPVSKKRKKKQRKGPPPSKSRAVPKKKKITKQQILIYVISGLMIISLAIGFLASGSTRVRPTATPLPQNSNILLDTPAPDDQSREEEGSAAPDDTSESTTEN